MRHEMPNFLVDFFAERKIRESTDCKVVVRKEEVLIIYASAQSERK